MRGATPVLVTSMERRNFDTRGNIVHTLGGYPAAMRAVADESDVTLIDLEKMSTDLYARAIFLFARLSLTISSASIRNSPTTLMCSTSPKARYAAIYRYEGTDRSNSKIKRGGPQCRQFFFLTAYHSGETIVSYN